MELESYEAAKESLEFLIRTGDWQIVSMAKNCSFVKLHRNKYPNTEWAKIETQISNWVLDEVMGIYVDILLYRKQPNRVLEYIKSRLRWYPSELRGGLIELLNYCINDEKRIPPKDTCISYLRNELDCLEASELEIGERLKGSDHSSFFGIEPSGDEFLEAMMYATGYMKSEKEEIDELSKRYFELTGSNIISESLPPQPLETKTDKFKSEMGKYGFFELPKVKQLSEPNQQSLIELIHSNSVPYGIAMFDFLGFLEYLMTKHFTTGEQLHKEIAKWLEVSSRCVKGNISVLNEVSKENRTRYTANQDKQTVQNDYQKLK